MYCIKCGVQVPATARFCPSCGAAAPDGGAAIPGTGTAIPGPGTAATNVDSQNLRSPHAAQTAERPKSRLLAIIGGIVVVGVIAAVALFMARRPAPSAQSALPESAAPADKAPAPALTTPATVGAGYDWSGLSPEQLHQARVALDAAIAKEEQAAASQRVP